MVDFLKTTDDRKFNSLFCWNEKFELEFGINFSVLDVLKLPKLDLLSSVSCSVSVQLIAFMRFDLQ